MMSKCFTPVAQPCLVMLLLFDWLSILRQEVNKVRYIAPLVSSQILLWRWRKQHCSCVLAPNLVFTDKFKLRFTPCDKICDYSATSCRVANPDLAPINKVINNLGRVLSTAVPYGSNVRY